VEQVLVSEPSRQEVLARFSGVYLQDGTILSLPPSMKEEWPGCGGSTPEAGVSSLRVQARLDLARGGLQGLWLQAGHEHEASGPAIERPVGAGSLCVVDLGYWQMLRMKQMTDRGEYWECPAKLGVVSIDQRGIKYDLQTLLDTYAGEGEVIDIPVQLGAREQVSARLIAQKLPPEQARQRRKRSTQSVTMPPKGVQRLGRHTQASAKAKARKRKRRKISHQRLNLLDWTIIVTNAPVELLSPEEAVVLLRCRWQMELLWKLWKQLSHLDTWRSAKPERILTEILAKLLACLFQHWLTVLGCWHRPDRSMVKAHQVVQWMAPAMALAFAGVVSLQEVIGRCATVMAHCCSMNPRRKRPNTYQLLNPSKLNSS
jgi:Transposase DDE domain